MQLVIGNWEMGCERNDARLRAMLVRLIIMMGGPPRSPANPTSAAALQLSGEQLRFIIGMLSGLTAACTIHKILILYSFTKQ